MFPVSSKKALNKMHCYNKAKRTEKQPQGIISNIETNEQPEEPSMEEGGLLELPTLPSTYFESQKGMGEWINHTETFSPNSKARFQQWAKATPRSLGQAELQHQSYHNVQARIQEEAKGKCTSRCVIQKGGMITIEAARVRNKEKVEKEKVAAIKKAQKSIQSAVKKAKAKATLNRHGIDAHKAEREGKRQVKMIQAEGGILL